MKEQLSIAGTEPPENPKVRDALRAWLDARDEQHAAAEKAKAKRDAMLMHMVEAGVERYPYVDSKSGKRRFVVADKTPKAKTIAAAGSPSEKKRSRERDVQIGDEVVESRRVSRTKEHEQLADPFAATRKQMEH